jgi:hypothetical protein
MVSTGYLQQVWAIRAITESSPDVLLPLARLMVMSLSLV